MLQLVKKELKLQPWALFWLLLFVMLVVLIGPTYQYKSLLYTIDQQQTTNTKHRPISESTAYYTESIVNQGKQIISNVHRKHSESGQLNSSAQKYYLHSIKKIIYFYQVHDYKSVNQTVFKGIHYRGLSKQNIKSLLNLFDARSSRARPLLDAFVKSGVNASPLISYHLDILPIIINYFGGGLYMEKNDEAIKKLTLVFILCFAILISAATTTHERRWQTVDFWQTIPAHHWFMTIVKMILTILLLNLYVLVGLLLSVFMLHFTTGLPIGYLDFGDIKIIQHQQVVFTLGRYLLTILGYLNLWFIFLIINSALLSQLTKSPIVITFILAINLFSRQLGLLNLVPKTAKIYFPANYTDFYAMLYRSGDYGNMSNVRLIAIFAMWSLTGIALIAILNTIRRRHYIAMLDN